LQRCRWQASMIVGLERHSPKGDDRFFRQWSAVTQVRYFPPAGSARDRPLSNHADVTSMPKSERPIP
jgi:hypothetical protein